MGKSKKATYIVCAVCFVLAILQIGVTFFLYRVLRGDVRESSNLVEDYHHWTLSEQYSHLLVFPENIPDSAKDVSYSYRYESGYTRPMCQIFLHCRLDEDDYISEVNRLSGLAYESRSDGEKTVCYDTDSFAYPAYVTIGGYDFCYEYALVDDAEQTIVYIYAMNTMKQDIKFDASYIPNYFMEDYTDISVNGLDRFTMYERYQNE